MINLNTAEEIIAFIKNSQKRTPVKAYINGDMANIETSAKIFRGNGSYILIGESDEINRVLEKYRDNITDFYIENDRRNSGVPTLDYRNINARIEPGAIIRDKVTIGNNAVIMMGAVINIGAVIGDNTMIDFYATFAQMLNHNLETEEAVDSYSMWPILSKKGASARKDLVHEAGEGYLSLRTSQLKLVFYGGSGGFSYPVNNFYKHIP